jgi:hypothetical protein
VRPTEENICWIAASHGLHIRLYLSSRINRSIALHKDQACTILKLCSLLRTHQVMTLLKTVHQLMW